ncbi:hypothetical protein AB0E01_26165 [Nocardia vinacea]|uniref:hypothetical protein n=1 Tax=Nocardia vinacea TaxID=96468 RepID=UPI0033D36F47
MRTWVTRRVRPELKPATCRRSATGLSTYTTSGERLGEAGERPFGVLGLKKAKPMPAAPAIMKARMIAVVAAGLPVLAAVSYCAAVGFA